MTNRCTAYAPSQYRDGLVLYCSAAPGHGTTHHDDDAGMLWGDESPGAGYGQPPPLDELIELGKWPMPNLRRWI